MRHAAMAMWRCSRSGRAMRAIAPKDQRLTAAALRVGRNRTATLGGTAAARRSLRRQGRCAGPADGAGRTGGESADHDRRAGLVPSRPLRRAAAGGDGAGQLRRAASPRAGGPRREGTGRRLRDRYRPHPAAPGQDGAGPAAAEGLALPAHRARFRLRRRGGYAGGEAGPRRQERRQGADHQRLASSTSSRARRWARAASRSPSRSCCSRRSAP